VPAVGRAAAHPGLPQCHTSFMTVVVGSICSETVDAKDSAADFHRRCPHSAGAYSEPLQVFDTIRILLGEIGWKDNDRQGDVTINLYVGGAYVVKGLKHEHMMLAERLNEMPKQTRKAMRDAAAAKVAEFGEFVKSTEAHVGRLGSRQCKSPASLTDHHRPTLICGSQLN
jgi:hypothetical protein